MRRSNLRDLHGGYCDSYRRHNPSFKFSDVVEKHLLLLTRPLTREEDAR